MKNLISKSPFLIILVLSILLFKECQSNKCPKYDAPTNLISNDTAQAYHEAYIEKYYNLPETIAQNNGVIPDDVSDVWYDLKVLEDYLNYVKVKSEALGLENPGIRVYFGAKKINGELKNTVFFTPTHRETTRAQEDPVNYNSYDIESSDYGTAGMPPNGYKKTR